MHDNGRERSPWEGVWVICTVLIIMPLIFWLIVGSVMRGGNSITAVQQNRLSARVVGFGLGSVFHLGCLICGVFSPSFKIVTGRVREFFENLTFSPRIAFSDYWWNIKQNGFAFWLYFIIMAGCAWIWIHDLIKFISLL